MIFFNPFYPPIHNIPNSKNIVPNDSSLKESSFSEVSSKIDQEKLSESNFSDSFTSKNMSLSYIYDLFSLSDNLIILGLIFILSKQKNTSKALLLCLISLLFEEWSFNYPISIFSPSKYTTGSL